MHEKPVVSTYIHVPAEAPISHTVDASRFGTSAFIRVGDYGENDATLFFCSAAQLRKLAAEATTAASQMESANRVLAEASK